MRVFQISWLVAITLCVITGFTNRNSNEPFISDLQGSPFGNHFWQIESATSNIPIDINLNNKPVTDLMILIPACERDDATQYRSDGIMILNKGKLICEEEDSEEDDDDDEIGTWTYDSKSKKLIIHHYDTRKPSEMYLKGISASRLTFTSEIISKKGKYTVTTILKIKK